jgi:hypothetical protein
VEHLVLLPRELMTGLFRVKLNLIYHQEKEVVDKNRAKKKDKRNNKRDS